MTGQVSLQGSEDWQPGVLGGFGGIPGVGLVDHEGDRASARARPDQPGQVRRRIGRLGLQQVGKPFAGSRAEDVSGKPGAALVYGGDGRVGFPRRVCGQAVQVGGGSAGTGQRVPGLLRAGRGVAGERMGGAADVLASGHGRLPRRMVPIGPVPGWRERLAIGPAQAYFRDLAMPDPERPVSGSFSRVRGSAGRSSVTCVRRSRMMSSTVWAMTSGVRSRDRP